MGYKETFISTSVRQISLLFWGDELAGERCDKRESFIVRARLILHHRQSREPSDQQSLVGDRRAVTQVYPRGGKLCYGVYLQQGITCRINASPARGISERRRHELRIYCLYANALLTRARKSNPPMWNSYVPGTGAIMQFPYNWMYR